MSNSGLNGLSLLSVSVSCQFQVLVGYRSCLCQSLVKFWSLWVIAVSVLLWICLASSGSTLRLSLLFLLNNDIYFQTHILFPTICPYTIPRQYCLQPAKVIQHSSDTLVNILYIIKIIFKKGLLKSPVVCLHI